MKKIGEIGKNIVLTIVLLYFKLYMWIYNMVIKLFFRSQSNKSLKILHIWNVAGVANTLAYETRKLGIEADIIARRDLDKAKFCEVHPELFIATPSKFFIFFIKTIKLAKKYDILHVHWYDWIIPHLRFVYPRKVIIIHYHGSDIRFKTEKKKDKFRFANKITVSTPDLLDHIKGEYVPNPVDFTLFKRTKKAKKDTALFIQAYDRFTEARKLAIEEAEKRNLKLTIIERNKTIIPYKDFARTLEVYEYYIDIRQEPYRNTLLDSLSLTALQALALGNKVILINFLMSIVHKM